MTITEAYEILGVTAQDTDKAIRRRYHILMHRHHPDAGAQDGGRAARQVTEAYRLLCADRRNSEKSGVKKSRSAAPSFRRRENSSAYCRRKLYERGWDFPDGDEGDAGRGHHGGIYVGEGAYLWDPDREPFAFLARSVRLAAVDLVRDAAGDAGSGDAGAVLRIFHLLIQEFIRPLSCLRKLGEWAVPCGDDPSCFRLRGEIAADAAGQIAAAGMIVRGERLELKAEGMRIATPLGPVSFHEDALYYVVLPMLSRGCAELTCGGFRVAGNRGRPGGRAHGRIDADLLLRITDAEEADRPGDSNRLIRETLGKLRGNIPM